MAIDAQQLLIETEEKLVALESMLGAWVGTEPGSALLSKVKDLLERCHRLKALEEAADPHDVSDLIIEATAAERICMGAFTCEHHPLAVATPVSSTPLCRACLDQLGPTR